MMKNRVLIVTNIIILSCIIIGLLIFMFWGIGGNHDLFQVKHEILYSETYNLNDIEKIKTDLKSYDVEIKESNDNNFKVEVYGNEKNKDNIKLKVNNKELNIDQIGSSICFGFCYSDSAVVIYMPKENIIELDINTISGDIDIFDDILNKVNLKTTSGDIKVKNLEEAIINTTSGNVMVDKVKEAVINTVSGDINVDNTQNIKVKSTSGDITIMEVREAFDIKSTSGDVTIRDLIINNDSKVVTVSGDVTINLNNDADINVNTRSGDRDIKHSKGEYNLDIKTTSGDITVL